jgi:hypothetical protein
MPTFDTKKLFGGLALAVMSSSAMAITITLGDQDFTNATLLANPGDFTTPQAGEPAPMGVFDGGDLTPTSFSASWTFNFAAGAVSSAALTFGIFDHDSAAPGLQVASFTADGLSLTAALNTLFEGSGGRQAEVNVYMLTLPAGVVAAMADGSVTFSLALQGPGLQGSAGTTGETTQENGAALDFAQLDFQQQQQAAPEPATLLLTGLSIGALALLRRRRPA